MALDGLLYLDDDFWFFFGDVASFGKVCVDQRVINHDLQPQADIDCAIGREMRHFSPHTPFPTANEKIQLSVLGSDKSESLSRFIGARSAPMNRTVTPIALGLSRRLQKVAESKCSSTIERGC